MQTFSSFTENLNGGIAFKMIAIEGGSFIMGGSDENAFDREKPVHQVKISSFYLGQFPVTQALWEAVMSNNPSRFQGGGHSKNRPVEGVSWNKTQEFLQKLNNLTPKIYRLPTEAEWEFSARGGIHSDHIEGYLYAGSDKLKEVGWYAENSESKTHPVGRKLANELGLFDMSGNVYEWVEDGYSEGYYEECARQGMVSDPKNTGKGSRRVIRNGSWFNTARECRVSYRLYYPPGFDGSDFGFRLALSL